MKSFGSFHVELVAEFLASLSISHIASLIDITANDIHITIFKRLDGLFCNA